MHVLAMHIAFDPNMKYMNYIAFVAYNGEYVCLQASFPLQHIVFDMHEVEGIYYMFD
jgi:hypothetical protein